MRNLLVAAGLGLLAWAAAPVYSDRWVYVSRNLQKDSDVTEIREIVRTAAAHGINGMALSAGLDRLDRQSPEYFRRLDEVRAVCRENKVELIPLIFSVGYGGSVLAHDRNLAEGIPVRDALFVVRGGEARLEPDPPVAFVNGNVEQYKGNQAAGFRLQEQPGEISFVDTAEPGEGKASLRFENFTRNAHGHARVMQEIAVRPHRAYRVSFLVKTEQLAPEKCFRFLVLSPDGRTLAPWDPRVPATTAWRRVTWGFNSADYDKVRIYAGAWGAKSGRFWMDDFRIEEVGPLNVLRRPGTPVSVRGEDGTAYQEERDYARIADPSLNFRYDHDAPPIRLLPGGRIPEGARLRVSWYHGTAINNGQVSVCMSEPRLYEIYRDEARRLRQAVGARRFILSMDEIREAGTCEACHRRHLSLAQILGACITEQMKILRETTPQAEVWAWSDMLDPNHNAHGNYYLTEGDYTGSWNYVPKDLGIVCWYYAKRNESLAHFSKLGFRTLAGAYYDSDTLDNPRGWLEALHQTPGATGIMYTTWQNKYKLLGAFGDLVSPPR